MDSYLVTCNNNWLLLFNILWIAHALGSTLSSFRTPTEHHACCSMQCVPRHTGGHMATFEISTTYLFRCSSTALCLGLCLCLRLCLCLCLIGTRPCISQSWAVGHYCYHGGQTIWIMKRWLDARTFVLPETTMKALRYELFLDEPQGSQQQQRQKLEPHRERNLFSTGHFGHLLFARMLFSGQAVQHSESKR